MSRFLLVTFLLVAASAWAVDSAEEALILNQEMQFLEDTAKNGPIISTIDPLQDNSTPTRAINDDSLERQYFGSDEDTVKTKTAAPKRTRSL